MTARTPAGWSNSSGSPSWGEHLRQHGDRLTASEQANLDRVLALAETETHTVDHLFATRTHRKHLNTR